MINFQYARELLYGTAVCIIVLAPTASLRALTLVQTMFVKMFFCDATVDINSHVITGISHFDALLR